LRIIRILNSILILLIIFTFNSSCRIKTNDIVFSYQKSYMPSPENDQTVFSFIPDNPYSSMNSSGTKGYNLGSDGLPVETNMYASILGRYGLKLGIQYLKNKNPDTLNLLKKTAHRLIEISVDEGSYITWEFPDEYTPFNAEPGWTSGLTNAWGALALLYYGEFIAEFDKIESKLYITYAKKALNYIFIPIEQGGGKTTLENGYDWYEEYPSEPSSHVLNGFVFILDVLHVFAFYYPTEYAEPLNKGIASVYYYLERYNKAYTSIYDLYTYGNRIGSSYHSLHMRMISWLYYITDNHYFREVSEHWYNLNVQNIYSVSFLNNKEVKATDKINNINDFKYWYRGHFFGLFSRSLILTLPRKAELYGINFYLTKSDIDSIPVIEVETDTGWMKIDQAHLYQSPTNVTKYYRTTAFSVIFSDVIETEKVRITFTKLPLNVREIGLLYQNTQDFEDIIEKYAKAYRW